jgi:hypothetical protein
VIPDDERSLIILSPLYVALEDKACNVASEQMQHSPGGGHTAMDLIHFSALENRFLAGLNSALKS